MGYSGISAFMYLRGRGVYRGEGRRYALSLLYPDRGSDPGSSPYSKLHIVHNLIILDDLDMDCKKIVGLAAIFVRRSSMRQALSSEHEEGAGLLGVDSTQGPLVGSPSYIP